MYHQSTPTAIGEPLIGNMIWAPLIQAMHNQGCILNGIPLSHRHLTPEVKEMVLDDYLTDEVRFRAEADYFIARRSNYVDVGFVEALAAANDIRTSNKSGKLNVSDLANLRHKSPGPGWQEAITQLWSRL